MKIYLLMVLISACLISVFGQTKNKRSKPVAPTDKTYQSASLGGYSDKPFNLNVERLPPYFLGTNARLILPKLLDFAFETLRGCGKFETTEICQNRLNGIYDRPFWRGLTGRDLISFSVPVSCDYNADSERSVCSYYGKDFPVSQRLIGSRTYVGENIFGVKKLIQYQKFENISIKTEIPGISLIIDKINPRDAEKVLPNLRFLVIGEILQPFADIDTVERTPTISEPKHIKGDNYTITLEKKAIWLYDITTGKIWGKSKSF